MKIRDMVPDDRDGIEAALRSDKTFRTDEIEVALELFDQSVAGDSYEFLVANVDDEIAGYVCFGLTPMTDSTYDLYWIVTHAAHRGRGIASQLVEAMESALRARGGVAVRVETSETENYGGARKLYAKLGYPQASLLTDFYRPGDGLITYYKKL